MKSRLILAVLLALGFATVGRAAAIEPTMYEAPTELSRVTAMPSPQTGGGHSASLTWILSTDDTTVACTPTANCLQNVHAPAAHVLPALTFRCLPLRHSGPHSPRT
jgi:hypothetical protein